MAAIRTKSGRLVDPFKITVEDVREIDFLHALSCINRYTGWAKYPYSVGQHSYVLYKHVPKTLRRAAVVHDFAEAFFNDLATPIKKEFKAYKRREHEAMVFIANVHGVSEQELQKLDPYDKAIYIDERNVLFDNLGETGMGDERTGLGIDPWFFRERPWREVYMDLSRAYIEAFNG